MSTLNAALPALRRMHLSLEDAYKLTDEELLAVPNFGKACLDWVRSQQQAAGVPPTSRKLIKIHRPVFKIIRELGLTPELVKEMTITTKLVHVTLYEINETGNKYIDTDTGEPATKQQTFEVLTSEKLPHPPSDPFSFIYEVDVTDRDYREQT